MERMHLATPRTGALRKQNDRNAAVERLLKLRLNAVRRAFSSAVDVDRSRQRCDPADDRPEFHLALGHKYGRRCGAEYQDIEIAEVVGNQQST